MEPEENFLDLRLLTNFQNDLEHKFDNPDFVSDSFIVGDIVKTGDEYFIIKSFHEKCSLLVELLKSEEKDTDCIYDLGRQQKIVKIDDIEHSNSISVKKIRSVKNKLFESASSKVLERNTKEYRMQVIHWNVLMSVRRLLSASKNNTSVNMDITPEDYILIPKNLINSTVDLVLDQKGRLSFENLFGKNWELPQVKNEPFSFVSKVRVSMSKITLKLKIKLWKATASFQYEENYQDQYRMLEYGN